MLFRLILHSKTNTTKQINKSEMCWHDIVLVAT